MASVHRPTNRFAQEPSPHRRLLRIAVALFTLLGSTLLGATFAQWSRGVGGTTCSPEPEHHAAQDLPSASQAPDPYTFVGTVPKARIDERAISPIETVGASAN